MKRKKEEEETASVVESQLTAFFVSQSNLKSLFEEPFTLIVSHDRYEVDNNAASACLHSDKVIKRQIEMRGDEEESENYRGPLNATWFQ